MICPACDAITEKVEIAEGHQAHCQRCDGVVIQRKVNPLNRTIAIACGGILLLVPALILPLFGVKAAGHSNQASLIDCLEILIEREQFIIATCLFLFTVAAPTIRLISALYVCLRIKLNWYSEGLLHFFRSYKQLDTWAMLNVLMLGMIVTMYKLFSLAELTLGLGLLAMSLFLLLSTLLSLTMDEHLLWDKLEQGHG